MTNSLLISKDSRGVITLTLNRADVRNAFDDQLIASLTKALHDIAQDKTVRVVLIKGAGKAFCAGADLNWMQSMVNFSYEENLADAEKLAELMYCLNELPQPTIAVVQGAAYGGGVGLAACCDLVLASEQASFCLSEVKLGLIPAVISPFVLAKIGQKAMRRYMLTAEVFSASQARIIGLVDEVFELSQLEIEAEKFVAQLLNNAPEAMAEMKVLLQHISNPQMFENIREETVAAIAQRRISPEGQAGLKAFLQKQKAS